MKQEKTNLIIKEPKYIKEKSLIIDKAVIEDIEKKTNSFSIVVIYMRLLANQQQNGLYYGNQNDLSKICDISTKTLNKAIKKLRELGYIDMKRQKNNDTIYIVYTQKKESAN